jgi:hypothetical protein
MSDTPASWQPDPTGRHDHRYWDGSAWTDHVADAGVSGTDPLQGPPATAEPTTDETAAAETADETPVEDAVPEGAAPEGDEATPTAEEPPAAAAAPPAEDQEPAGGPDDDTVVTAPVAAPSGDDTAVQSAVNQPVWPPAGPAYVPPTPVATGGPEDKGPDRRLLVGGGILAVVVLALLAFVAFSGDDDEPSVRAQLASAMQREFDGVNAAEAQCVADALVDERGEDAFADADLSGDELPPEVVAAAVDVGVVDLAEQCDLTDFDFGTTDSGSTDGDTGNEDEDDLQALYDDCAGGDLVACDDLYYSADLGSELETFGSTCGNTAPPQFGECEATNGGEDPLESADSGIDIGDPDALAESFADSFEAAYDISRDQAECLADRLVEAVEEGTLDAEEAVANFFDYLADCGLSQEDLMP